MNHSGDWTGVVGALINGEYPLSLSQWNYDLERDHLIDFVSVGSARLQLAFMPQPEEFDVGLFLRPFTHESWMAILGASAVIFAVIVLPYLVLR